MAGDTEQFMQMCRKIEGFTTTEIKVKTCMASGRVTFAVFIRQMSFCPYYY